MDGVFGDKLDRILSDRETMDKIKEIAASIKDTSGQKENTAPTAPQNIPAAPSKIGGYCAVLGAIRPYLDQSRQARIDKTLRALKMAETAKTFIGV